MTAQVVAVPVGANAYNSLWQVRNDAWSSLEESTAQLARARAQQRPVDQLTETVTETLNLLGPIERFWWFPGPHAPDPGPPTAPKPVTARPRPPSAR
jgi:hypothetical protein